MATTFDDNLFAAQFNMHKVTRHALSPQGATFVSRDEDFLVSDNLDFHPTDVVEDADGSLVVIDTGGWYKLCCPSSQLWKPEVAGGIYRVPAHGGGEVADPRGTKLAWSDATPEASAAALEDARPAVRRRAVHELAAAAEIVPALQAAQRTSSDATARARSVWTLARIDHRGSQAAAVRVALGDTDETVRQAAIHTSSVARDQRGGAGIDQDPAPWHTAESPRGGRALGRLDDRTAVPVLLEVAGEELDRTLEHSVTYALIELAAPQETAAGLASANPRTRRARPVGDGSNVRRWIAARGRGRTAHVARCLGEGRGRIDSRTPFRLGVGSVRRGYRAS